MFPMLPMFRSATYLALTLFVAAPLFGSQPRAQDWKPTNAPLSQRLLIEGIERIVIPATESKALRAALDDLQETFADRHGHSLSLQHQGTPKRALIFQRHAPQVYPHGAFAIHAQGSRVFIRGSSDEGWINAIYAIAQEMLGARWYWSGSLGFEWAPPAQRAFAQRLHERPAFVQRRLHPVNTDFARRNRLNDVYSFNHNLARVFSPELFKSQPEVFAEVNGQRKPPRGNGGTDPQPDLTHPAAVEIAAQAALDHFGANPSSNSFSLSINDNVLFDTSARTEAAVSPLRYFRTRPDYTDLVFGFMNRVAERVFDEAGAWQTSDGEDRYLTALAYYWTEPAPTISIHPRVMPVLTSDRAQWHDPAYRAEDKKLIEAWVASGAERIATWDYYFGAPYPYPRQFNQWIAESLQFMSEAGVDVLFSQLPSFWGLDGAKAWLAAELLWDPQQDAAALLDEYYTNFFGAAAEPIRNFYELAEQYRNENEGKADWIKLYKDESSIALFTPEVLQQMRGHLAAAEQAVGLPPLGGQGIGKEGSDQAVGVPPLGGQGSGKEGSDQATPDRLKAGLQPEQTARFAARVQVVSQAFQLTELYSAMDQSRRALVIACFDESPAVVATKLAAFEAARAAYEEYFEQYIGSSEYAPERRRIALGQSQPERLAAAVLQAESRSFRSLSDDPQLMHLGYVARNFLGPVLPNLDGWHLDYRASEHFKVIASRLSEAGDAGIRIEGADIVSLFRKFPVVSNRDYELRMRAAWQISLDNRAHVHVAWLDREGHTLGSEVPLRLPLGQRAEHVQIHLPFTAPNNAYDLRVRVVVSRQYPGDYLDISEIDFGMLR